MGDDMLLVSGNVFLWNAPEKIDLVPTKEGQKGLSSINFWYVSFRMDDQHFGRGKFLEESDVNFTWNDGQIDFFEHKSSSIWQFCYVRYVCLRWIRIYKRRVKVQELGYLPSTSMMPEVQYGEISHLVILLVLPGLRGLRQLHLFPSTKLALHLMLQKSSQL